MLHLSHVDYQYDTIHSLPIVNIICFMYGFKWMSLIFFRNGFEYKNVPIKCCFSEIVLKTKFPINSCETAPYT